MRDNIEELPWSCPDTFGKENTDHSGSCPSELIQWPLKLTKVSPVSPYFHKAHLLIAADCSAFSYTDFHQGLLRQRVLMIGCPDIEDSKLLDGFRQIITLNDILSIRVVRTDAPCCQKWIQDMINIVKNSGKQIPMQITTVFTSGEDVGTEELESSPQ